MDPLEFIIDKYLPNIPMIHAAAKDNGIDSSKWEGHTLAEQKGYLKAALMLRLIRGDRVVISKTKYVMLWEIGKIGLDGSYIRMYIPRED